MTHEEFDIIDKRRKASQQCGVLNIIDLALKKTKYGVIAKVGEGNGATPATY